MVSNKLFLFIILFISSMRFAYAADLEFIVPIEIDKIYPNVTPVVRCGVYSRQGDLIGWAQVAAKRGGAQKTTVIIPVNLKTGYHHPQAHSYSCVLFGRLDDGKLVTPKYQHVSTKDEFKAKQGSLLRYHVKGLLSLTK